MTNRPLKKQVIVLMSNNNSKKFMADSSAHIININRAFKNIKSEVKANFIQTEQLDIVIVTNKIASLLNLQTIKQYVKNADQIKVNNIKHCICPVRLTEFGSKFLLNSLFILFFLFSLLVSTLGTRDGVWHDVMATWSQ